jgi:hypothetical protein
MNDKIKAWQGRLSDKLTGRGRPNGGSVAMEALVTLRKSTERNRKNQPHERDIMRVSFHNRIDALTGWKRGDVLDMEIDGDVAIVYRSDRGVHLCSGDPKGTDRKGRKYIRCVYPQGSLADLPVGVCRDVETAPGKIAFKLPA